MLNVLTKFSNNPTKIKGNMKQTDNIVKITDV